MPSMQMRPVVDLVEAHQQVDQGRLAGAGRPDDGDRLARLDDQVEVLDERDVGQVAERDVLELDPPGDRAADPGERDVRRLLGLVEQLEHPLGRGDRGLDDVGDAGGLGDRHRELARVLDEGLDVAEAHLAVRHLDAADDADQDVVDVGDELHRPAGSCPTGTGLDSSPGRAPRSPRRTGRSPRCWRPNALTMLCPVCISSTWPLSLPVCAHWAANWTCERLATKIVTTIDSGHRQQRDDGQQRADPEHHREDADDRAAPR